MNDEKSIQVGQTVLIFDVLLTVLAFIFAFMLREKFISGHIHFYSHIALLPLLLVLVVMFLTYFGAYQSPRYMNIKSYSAFGESKGKLHE